MIRLSIPEASPSLNTCRKHWSYHVKLRKHWSMLVMVAKVQAGGINGHHPLHARVTVTRIGKRSLDHDNFIGGLKPLLDGLKDHGLIMDDDAQHLTLTGVQMPLVKGDSPATIIEITSAEGPA